MSGIDPRSTGHRLFAAGATRTYNTLSTALVLFTFSPPTTPWVKRVYVTNVPVTKGSVVCRVQPAAYSHDRRRYNPFSLFPPSRISIFAIIIIIIVIYRSNLSKKEQKERPR